MKVTAIIPDELIKSTQHLTKQKTITAAIIKALDEWGTSKKLALLNQKIQKNPLKFKKGFSAETVRLANRTR